jgi:hypothetical protein
MGSCIEVFFVNSAGYKKNFLAGGCTYGREKARFLIPGSIRRRTSELCVKKTNRCNDIRGNYLFFSDPAGTSCFAAG